MDPSRGFDRASRRTAMKTEPSGGGRGGERRAEGGGGGHGSTISKVVNDHRSPRIARASRKYDIYFYCVYCVTNLRVNREPLLLFLLSAQ